ncbi:hypothetical protein D3C85_1452790 [compost metagenome]
MEERPRQMRGRSACLKSQEAALRHFAKNTKWIVATIGAAKTAPAKLTPTRNTLMLQAATPNPSPNS